jgi:hypothetical protein
MKTVIYGIITLLTCMINAAHAADLNIKGNLQVQGDGSSSSPGNLTVKGDMSFPMVWFSLSASTNSSSNPASQCNPANICFLSEVKNYPLEQHSGECNLTGPSSETVYDSSNLPTWTLTATVSRSGYTITCQALCANFTTDTAAITPSSSC